MRSDELQELERCHIGGLKAEFHIAYMGDHAETRTPLFEVEVSSGGKARTSAYSVIVDREKLEALHRVLGHLLAKHGG